MAVDYKKIGLVNTKDMFARAAPGYHPGFFKLEVTSYPSGI